MDESSSHYEGPNKTERTPVNISNAVTSPAQMSLSNKQSSSMNGQIPVINSEPSSPSRKDPLAYKAASTTGDNNIKFEFIRSGESSSAEDEQTHSKRLRPDEEGHNIDHKSLLEGIHNVERREDQPKKRIKTAVDEKPIARIKPEFEVSGNSGLGEYMKGEKGPSNTASQVVDLTSGKIYDTMTNISISQKH